ncbi:MAK10-like protein [Tanacetum coccineum]
MGDKNPIRTLGDYSKPSHEGYRNTIDAALSITTWEDLTTRFLAQFFPPGRTAKLRNDILMFQQHHEESLSEAWTRFKDLLQKVPHHGIDLWLQVQIFYDHVNPVTRRTIDQSAGGKLRDRNAKESWALLEDLALYDNESWNDPRDFAKPVKAVALPQDVPSTSDRRLIEIENQVKRLMEAHLALTQPTQGNKIITSCEVCSGPHDTHNCMKVPEQTCVDYASSRMNKMGGKRLTLNEIYQIKLEKALLDFNSHQEKRLSHLKTQLGQQQDDMIEKINLLWKTISKKLNDTSSPENAKNSMAPKNITVISYDEREELRKNGIKSPSKLLSPKYLSPASIKELNKNPSSPKRVHFVNSIVILSTDSDTEEEDVSSTNACDLNLGGMVKGKKGVKEQGEEDNEMETDMEVGEVIEEEESEFEIDEEVEEIIEEEEDDEDGENFNLFPTLKELTHHAWILKNPRPPWVKARIRVGSPNNIKISCMVGHPLQETYFT